MWVVGSSVIDGQYASSSGRAVACLWAWITCSSTLSVICYTSPTSAG